MSLKSSLFMKLLQLVFTVSDREWRLRLYVQCCLEVACSKRDEYCSVCSQKKVVVHVSCELRRRKIVTETRKNELGENWLQGLLRNFFSAISPIVQYRPFEPTYPWHFSNFGDSLRPRSTVSVPPCDCVTRRRRNHRLCWITESTHVIRS